MSRCFPFPPPGYMRNGARSEDLIESIKLQKEREDAKKDQKKEKRKTKEKRKERKERKEKEGKAKHAREGKGQESKLKNVESYQLEKIRAEPSSGYLLKGDEDETEQLERSGITEEHDQPVSCLSDSTQSSIKRKRSPSSNDRGTTFRIRLPLRKHREPEESQQDQLGSTSASNGTADSLTPETRRLPCITNAETFPCLGNPDSEHCKELQGIQDSSGVDLNTNLLDDESSRMASEYNSLFHNFISHPLPLEGQKLEDQDWLFPSELIVERPAPKKVKSVNGASRCSSPTVWPRSQYLPEADLYALPYAVPF